MDGSFTLEEACKRIAELERRVIQLENGQLAWPYQYYPMYQPPMPTCFCGKPYIHHCKWA